MRRTAILSALLLSVLCPPFSATAAAQANAQLSAQPGSESSPEARKEASERFQRGVELYQEQAFRAALVEFERAYAIAPDYRLLYNIGQVQSQLADYLSATNSYERYLAQGGAVVPKARREAVEKELQILNERVGRLMIESNAKGAEIFVDDQQVGVTPLASAVLVNVGRHRVYARGTSGAVASKVIDIAGGDSLEVRLTLEGEALAAEAPETIRAPMSTTKKLALASLAVGGVALVGAVVTGVLAKGKIDDRKTELKRELPDQGKLRDLGDSATGLALTTDLFGGLAVAGVAAGVALWIIDNRSQNAEQRLPHARGPSWQVGLGTLSAKGWF